MDRKIYFENLDGLRFVCFLMVFFFHSFHTEFDYIKYNNTYNLITRDIFGNGNLGVNFFFVLSGFLITYLLIHEKKVSGKIHITKFWIRRILRIWPLFYFCVLFGFYAFPILKKFFGMIPSETAKIQYYLFFLNNFDLIKNGLPDASILGVLWSVAIEEQFYFLWPVLLSFVSEKKYIYVFVSIIIISICFRGINYFEYKLYEYHTLSCIGVMAVGGFGAWLISTSNKFKLFVENLNRYYIIVIYLLFIFFFFFRDELFRLNILFITVFERILIAFTIIFIILEQCYSKNSFYKMTKLKLFTKLGNITYGLYCLHFIGILITINITKILGINSKAWQVYFLETGVALLLTILLASLSYKYFEKPFLRLKVKFSIIKTK